jgi:hypothetical protein
MRPSESNLTVEALVAIRAQTQERRERTKAGKS